MSVSGATRAYTVRGVVALVFVALAFAVLLAACEGCRSTGGAVQRGSVDGPEHAQPTQPTVRLYFVSDLAGALEPCGCVKEQLGGLDHAAAWINGERRLAPHAMLLASGPLFFLDPELKPERKEQDLLKAKTLAASLRGLGLQAFVPGKN